jgi:hypothetical protein
VKTPAISVADVEGRFSRIGSIVRSAASEEQADFNFK